MYQFAYRFESQTGIHPTAFAVDQMLTRDGDTIRVNADPVRASYADPYGVIGVGLLDMLDAAGEAVASMNVATRTADARRVIHYYADESARAVHTPVHTSDDQTFD